MNSLLENQWIPLPRVISLLEKHPIKEAKSVITDGLKNGDIRSIASTIQKYRLAAIEYDFESRSSEPPPAWVVEMLKLGEKPAHGLPSSDECKSLQEGIHELSDDVDQLVIERGKNHATVYMSSASPEPKENQPLTAAFWDQSKIFFDTSVAISYDFSLRQKLIARGVVLQKSDVEAFFAADNSASGLPKPITFSGKQGRKTGRKSNTLWEDTIIKAAEFMFREGRPDTLTPIINHVLGWLQEQTPAWYKEKAADRPQWAESDAGSEHPRGPGLTAVREHIQPLYEALRSVEDSPEDLLIEMAAFIWADGLGETEDQTIAKIVAEFSSDSTRVRLLSPKIRKLHRAMKIRSVPD